MSKRIYKIIFINQGKVYEIFAGRVYQADLYGFIAVEEIIFGERSSVVVDPGEERLKSEFGSVTQSYIPMHSVIRIDQVEKEGSAKITELGDKVAQFPTPLYTPGGKGGKE